MTVPAKKHNKNLLQKFLANEHDSCGIVAVLEKDGFPRRENMLDALNALTKMDHRSGFLHGEGDGCGILTDLPRDLWARELAERGFSPNWVHSPRFAVAHLFLPKDKPANVEEMKEGIRHLITRRHLLIVGEKWDAVDSSALGPIAREAEPHFWQIAVLANREEGLPCVLFELGLELERRFPLQVVSISKDTVVYKVMGSASILPKYFHDLAHPAFSTRATIGHNRYSTNTRSHFFRVQPFSLLGHNGEINTISKLREEARMIGVELPEGGSDSQDLNRLLETLIHRYGMSLPEAIEMVFPPIHHEIKQLPRELQDLYAWFRQAWGPFAQGPAGIVSRYGDECAFRVDALGLRPLWILETDRALYFSSEQGIVPAVDWVKEPKPIAPGETVGVQLAPEFRVIPYAELQELVLARVRKRIRLAGHRAKMATPPAPEVAETPLPKATDAWYAAYGWEREQIQLVENMAEAGSDPIRSLGHDAPLAALADTRQNLADFIKESVAVVTNPAIDREREMEHFSTRAVVGTRPDLTVTASADGLIAELPSPILLEGKHAKIVSRKEGTLTWAELLELFGGKGLVCCLPLSFQTGTSISDALSSLERQAVEAAQKGCTLLVLDDATCHQGTERYLDPLLAVARIDDALKTASPADGGQNLRRRLGIAVRSAALRSLHDVALALGLGADVLSPYLMFATVEEEGEEAAHKLFQAINKGLEKILSTIGIHELRGYARLFSAIGLKTEVAEALRIINWCGSEKAGFGFAEMEKDAEARAKDFAAEAPKPARLFRLWPRVWKPIGQLAAGEISYAEFAAKLEEIEQKNPVALRHVTDLVVNRDPVDPADVDLSVGIHSLPLVISSMSFGSQGEVAFRAYAEAADRLNMVSLNGEGGEIKDMLGKYPNTRGHQIASGRFGVNVELVNSSNLLEIKIGQGAKPGEGGHLPGKKVSPKVAAARNATVGSDLISPSNNHDIYSIEDLAQIIAELKTANPRAKVIVKVPIVPNIGTIAVGIVKAGADIVTVSGFDGGTGAARIHALQHVGLPAEIGVKAVHTALLEAGLRDQVEVWADGGVRSALDAIKLMLLGANRIGFGTLAMLAVGCTACRGCHLDTCHVGIATQIETVEEATKHGLRRFVPREFDRAVEALMTLFGAFAEEMKRLTALLGFKRTQDLVGRSDLLVQTRCLDRVDLTELLTVPKVKSLPVPVMAGMSGVSHAESGLIPTGSTSLLGSNRVSAVHSAHRVLIGDLSGKRVYGRLDGSYRHLPELNIALPDGSVPGNGFAAYHADGIRAIVKGGAQDGVGKTAYGGRVAILKTKNRYGVFVGGSVGKGFCYGAQKGLFIVQGHADSRAGIRLSGADLIIGGEIEQPLDDGRGLIATRANIKGFAFEYMTAGRAVVLGDPGPWICSGMTGGVVYLRLVPEMGLDEAAIRRRIAKAAKVRLQTPDEKGVSDLKELLGAYHEELLRSGQIETAERITELMAEPERHFVQIIPVRQQADPSVSTE
jgi:glutamate synthase (NADPH/NADH) large chain